MFYYISLTEILIVFSATLTITVTDVNDQPPGFSLGDFYNASIRENMPDGSDIEFQNSKTLEVYDTDDKVNFGANIVLINSNCWLSHCCLLSHYSLYYASQHN